MNIETYGKNIDSYTLRGVVVQGENGTDTITFKLDPSETGYTWRVRGTINGGSVQSSEIEPREETSAVYIDWTVADNFTQYAGTMYLTLVGVNGDDEITKRVGSVDILPDMAMQAAGTVTQNLFEQLIAAIGNKVEDSEAWAVGTRAGVPVTSDDPAYQNNSRYYSEHPATVDAGTASSLPSGSTPTVENVGTQQHAVFNFGIPSGSQGTAATIQVGTVETLPAGSDATVVNAGTTGAAVLNFGIPRGHDGGGSGTVTSVGVSAASGGGLTVSGSPITSSGTIQIRHSNTATAKSNQALYKAKIDGNGHLYDVGDAVPVYADMVTVTASTTLTSSHYGKMVLADSSSAITVTLPTSTGGGEEIEIVQIGTGKVSIGGTVFSFESKTDIAGQYGAVVAKAIGNGVWLLAGCLG